MRGKLGAAAAIAAAIAGAGFASGREIAAFFGRFGAAGWAGAVVAAALIGFMARGLMLLAMRMDAAGLPGLMAQSVGHSAGSGVLMALLMLAVGAAMIAAGGELGALALYVQGARQIGMLLTAGLAALIAARGLSVLGALGGVTVIAMLGYFALLAHVPPAPAPVQQVQALPGALVSAAAYAGFNAAAACGVICAAGRRADSRRSVNAVGLLTGALMLAMLLAALYCVRRCWAICAQAAMPCVVMAALLGKPGYYATILVMWLAVLSTLAGAVLALEERGAELGLRALDIRLVSLSSMALIGSMGFDALVSRAYPALGLICAGYMALLLVRGARER